MRSVSRASSVKQTSLIDRLPTETTDSTVRSATRRTPPSVPDVRIHSVWVGLRVVLGHILVTQIFLVLVQFYSLYDTIRYDTIGEFNVDSKAECV